MIEGAKECPFCGCIDKQEMRDLDDHGEQLGLSHAVVCMACECEGPLKDTATLALAAWNVRSASPNKAPPPGQSPGFINRSESGAVIAYPPVKGVGRDKTPGSTQALVVYFAHPVTDDHMRAIHDTLYDGRLK